MNLLPDQTLIAQWIIFAVVYLVLTRLVFLPILQTLRLRSTRTIGLAEEAQAMAGRADVRLKDYEEQLARARGVALEQKDELIRQALKEKDFLLKEAKTAWDETIRQVRDQVGSELKSASLTIKGEVTLLARSITEKVLA